jgi:integrase
MKQFSWEPYLKVEVVKPKLVADWVREFEADYFNRRQRNPKSETTYEKDYRLTFSHLDPDAALTKELVLEAIALTSPDTRTRVRYCMALGALAKFAGIDVDLKAFRGSYSAAKAQARELPEDSVIEEWRSHLVNPAWQWVYGMLAVYGLRPHEVFHLDLERLRQGEKGLRVLDGKTGARLVFPFPLDWWKEWELWEVELPAVTAGSNSEFGNRVQQYFKRSGCPFRPYDLRHAWAVRTLNLGLDLTLASQQMGHSVGIHTQIYHRWISEKIHEEAFERLFRDNP